MAFGPRRRSVRGSRSLTGTQRPLPSLVHVCIGVVCGPSVVRSSFPGPASRPARRETLSRLPLRRDTPTASLFEVSEETVPSIAAGLHELMLPALRARLGQGQPLPVLARMVIGGIDRSGRPVAC